jgi:tetratricopeptide (TPR) repeat protein
MRNEANTFFAIANFNKSIELNSTIIKLIESKKTRFIELIQKNNYRKLKNNKSNENIENELIKEFDFSKSKTNEIITNCFNNRGNSYLRNNNFKEAINDFNTVIKRDSRNVKAYFRRSVAYFNLQVYNNSLRDLTQALNISVNKEEKKSIKNQIEKNLLEINTLVNNQMKRSENYELSGDTAFKRAKLNDLDDDLIQKIKDNKQKESNGEVQDFQNSKIL